MLLVEWNATDADYPRDKCVHELFEAQAARTPDAVAVEYEERQLTYGELNARANRLAHRLRRQGVGPGDRVALPLERSAELVAAELAMLKCGAAYVPIDPAFPGERQDFMIRDCGAKVVLAAEGGAALPKGLATIRLDVDERLPAEGRPATKGPCSDGGLCDVHLGLHRHTPRAWSFPIAGSCGSC